MFSPAVGDSDLMINDACLLNLKQEKSLKPCNALQLLKSKQATVMGEPCIIILDYWIIKDI